MTTVQPKSLYGSKNHTHATWNDHTPAQACPKVRLLVAECTNDANTGHLGGCHSNAGECKV